MRIGILICDQIRPEFEGQFDDYPIMLEQMMLKIDNTLEFTFYQALHGQLPESVDECDAYLTTGSKHSVNDDLPWIDNLIHFITLLDESKKKLVGICFGHQLIAKALGGSVSTSSKGWGIGVAFNQVTQAQSWMVDESNQAPSGLDIVVSHKEQVDRLPANTKVIASSAFCPNFLIQVENHMLGIQGHPEFSTDYSMALTNTRLELIPANRVREGFNSLNAHVDDLKFATWILNFFKNL